MTAGAARGTIQAISTLPEWLAREGLLRLRSAPAGPAPFSPEMVDWPRTSAWAEGGYYARIFLNVRGREPMGTVPPERVDELSARIRGELERLPSEAGGRMANRVFRPEEIYREIRGVPPDLMAFFGDLHWRAAATVGTGTLWLQENDTGPDDANHDWDGIFLCSEAIDPPRTLLECHAAIRSFL